MDTYTITVQTEEKESDKIIIVVHTSPAKNCPNPGGKVRDAITRDTAPGQINRLKQEHSVSSHSDLEKAFNS